MQQFEQLDYQKYPPGPELAAFVKYVWSMQCREAISSPDLLIPDGYPEIIFVLRGAYRKEWLTPKAPAVIIDRSCFVGIQTQTVLASRMRRCRLIGVKLQPVGAYQLFGGWSGGSANQNQRLEDFGPRWLRNLNAQLQDRLKVEQNIQVLLQALRTEAAKTKQDDKIKLARAILANLLAKGGQVSVQELAQQHNLSIRQFQRQFKVFFGITPKKFLNIIRFKQLYKESVLQGKLPTNYLQHGYYDQMHFIREFKQQLAINPSKSSNPDFQLLNLMAKLNA